MVEQPARRVPASPKQTSRPPVAPSYQPYPLVAAPPVGFFRLPVL